MSQIRAKIVEVKNVETLHIVTFDYKGTLLSMMSLDLNDKVSVGREVLLHIKPTHTVIAKSFSGEISYANHIKSKITSVEHGELLSSIVLEHQGDSFESIITKDSAQKMNLEEGLEVTVMVQASDLSIKEIVDV